MSNKRPILFCFAGPTASGKSTICQQLVAQDASLLLSLSTTTRAIRPGEQNEIHYRFRTKEEFQQMLAKDELIEHAEFSANFYGTEKKNIEQAIAEGRDLIFDIEVQGVKQLKKLYGPQVVVIFVFPASFAELKRRLEKRGTNSAEDIARRLKHATEEVELLRDPSLSDYFIDNAVLEQALGLSAAIIQAERQRLSRQEADYLNKLLK